MGNCLRLGISKIGLAWTKRRMKTSNKKNSISLLILGTQAVGKTTIALRLWKFKRTLPDLNYVQTKGFNTYAIRRKNKSIINLYDLGGHPSIQELWDHYYADAHGVIFVVDVSDQASLVDAGAVFAKVINDERVRGKPILLLANKQDLGGASEVELDSLMNLQEVVNTARCLTRLDESAATDLKNDKGIFDGFRWLVSHIENHYHELNDRVMNDTLDEKNREKARRAAIIQEQMDQSSAVLTNNIHHSSDRPSSQKSLVSRTFIREESSIDLQELTNDRHPTGGRSGGGIQRPNLETFRMDSVPKTTTTTNYLIKSRPNSSLGEQHNPFFLQRNVSTAPADKRRSLPILHPISGKNVTFGNRFFLHAPSNNGGSSQMSAAIDPFMVDGGGKFSAREATPSAPMSSSSSGGVSAVTGRLSPEGADSDEGIINHAFDDKTETGLSEVAKCNGMMTDTRNIVMMPTVVTDDAQQLLIETGNEFQFPSPDKFRKLVRTESSDTEVSQRAGEILMVTTLAQVHQDDISSTYRGRRGSTTSTHDSVALSLSSFKSEDTMSVMEGWRDEDETQSRSKQSHVTNSRGTTPPTYAAPQNHYHHPYSQLGDPVKSKGKAPRENYHRTFLPKDKEQKSRLRVGKGKNKTAPLPEMTISTISSQTQPASTSTVANTSSSAPLKTSANSGRNNHAMPLNSRKSRENVFNAGPAGGPGGTSKLKKKSGFSDSLETNSSSQFARRPQTVLPPQTTSRTTD
ncbi:uncharacterized protein LOC118436048 isoform X1 [Folsomia candida]|uniref:uncharacterized protein LOC118436048 isoform X1 n=1 Tax=Folsomia candida TaxID=158441 RepID=UPI001604D9BA|nr:uncharacterized protein LOC118436048 isoform X1 [Folsomia candida]